MSRIIHNEGRVKVSSGDTAIEFLEDKLAAGSNVTITKTGGGGDEGLTIAATASVSNEDIQDAIGGILADSDTVDFTYDDAANSITATIKDFSLTRHKFNRESFEELVYDLGITNGDRAGKELLSSNRTYYVLTSGNNGNSGLVNSSGGAFATIQRAIDIISDTLDIGGYDVTIQVGAGTFTSSSTTVPTVLLKPVTNSGGLVNIVGDTTTPANVTIESTGYSAIGTSSDSYGNSVYAIRGFTIVTNGSGTYGLQISSRFSVQLRNCILGSTIENKAIVTGFGFLYLTGDLTISGSCVNAFAAYNQALIIADSYFTVTIAGTPNFSYAFIVSDRVSSILWNSNKVTFSGGATGVRYVVSNNSVIYTAGGAEDYFPGDIDGITLGGFVDTETQVEDGSLLATKLHQASLQDLLYNLGFGNVTSEAIDDRVAALLQAGSNITLNYDDNANTLTITAVIPETPDKSILAAKLHEQSLVDLLYSLGIGGIDDERIDDRVAALLQPGSNISISYDDNANTLTISAIVGELADGSILAAKLNQPSLQELIYNLGFAQLGNTELYIPQQTSLDPATATFSSYGDANGVIYAIGTNYFTQSFSNPAPNTISVQKQTNGTSNATEFTDRNTGTGRQDNTIFFNNPAVIAWFDFITTSFISPSSVTFYASSASAGTGLSYWTIELQGSANNSTWVTLGTSANLSPNFGSPAWFTTTVTQNQAYYRYLRLRYYDNGGTPGSGAGGTTFEIEFYGNYLSGLPSYVIQKSDRGKLLTLGGSNTFTLRVPDNNSSNFKSGWYCFATYQGSATLTINAVGSATLNTACTLTGIGLNRLILIINLDGVNSWLVTDITRSTANDTKTLLESLTGNNRLDASAIKNLATNFDDKSIFAQKLHEPSLLELLLNSGFIQGLPLQQYRSAPTQPATFTYSSGGDTNGVVYSFGFDGTSYTNPYDSSYLQVKQFTNSTDDGVQSYFTDRDIATGYTYSNNPIYRWRFDFKSSNFIKPTTASCYLSTNRVTVYKVEGSNDGSSWTDLSSTTNMGSGWNTISCSTSNYYRYLSLSHAGAGSGSTSLLEIEWYGTTTGASTNLLVDSGFLGYNTLFPAVNSAAKIRLPQISGTSYFFQGWYCYITNNSSTNAIVTIENNAGSSSSIISNSTSLAPGQQVLFVANTASNTWLVQVTGLNTEQVQDAAGALATNTGEINLTYNDATNQLLASLNDRAVLATKLEQTSLTELLDSLGYQRY